MVASNPESPWKTSHCKIPVTIWQINTSDSTPKQINEDNLNTLRVGLSRQPGSIANCLQVTGRRKTPRKNAEGILKRLPAQNQDVTHGKKKASREGMLNMEAGQLHILKDPRIQPSHFEF